MLVIGREMNFNGWSFLCWKGYGREWEDTGKKWEEQKYVRMINQNCQHIWNFHWSIYYYYFCYYLSAFVWIGHQVIFSQPS